jgi:integrase
MPGPMGRAKGQGTIVPSKPTPTGQKRWRVAVTMADGHRVWRTARSQREAERIRSQLVEARELDLDPTRQTVAGFLRSWIASLRSAHHQRIRPRTLQHYEMTVERHIIPALGQLRLSQLTVSKVQAWVDADPASARSVNHHRAVLRRALNVAVRQRLLGYNPAALAETPDVVRDKSDPLPPAEIRALLEATRDDRLYPLWRLALATGLRLGELLGLAWDDVDLEHRTITITGQLQRLASDQGGDANGWARTPTKAARTLERIAIGADTAAVLEVHRIRQAKERTPGWRYFGLVFVTERGDPYHPSVVLMAFRRACEDAGIRRRRIHDLRHTHNRILKDGGVAEDERMARMGHNTTAMSRRYGGPSEDRDRAAADVAEAAFR